MIGWRAGRYGFVERIGRDIWEVFKDGVKIEVIEPRMEI